MKYYSESADNFITETEAAEVRRRKSSDTIFSVIMPTLLVDRAFAVRNRQHKT